MRSELQTRKLKSQLLAEQTKVNQLQRVVKTQKNKIQRLTKRLEVSPKKQSRTIDDFLQTKDISDVAKTMFKLQLHKPKTAYATDEKDLAKQMPAESTVRSWVSEYDIVPGLNEIILKKIIEYLMTLPPQQRLCALKFDEMSIRSAEEYSKKYDVIEGLVDIGNDNRKPEIAKHALLFCINSINAENNWRQLLSFGFNENGASAEELFEIIPQIIKDLRNAGADVRLIVCDQGSNNQKLFKLLNVSFDKPYFLLTLQRFLQLLIGHTL